MMTTLSPDASSTLSRGRKRKGTASTAKSGTKLLAAATEGESLWRLRLALVIGRHEHHVGGCDYGALGCSSGRRGARVELMNAQQLAARPKAVLGDLAEVGGAFELAL